MAPSTSPPCDSDDEDADSAHDRYLQEQAREVVRGEVPWTAWTREQAGVYLASILAEDFANTLTSVTATQIAAREAEAFLRLCKREQAALDAEDDDEGEGFCNLAGPIAAEEE